MVEFKGLKRKEFWSTRASIKRRDDFAAQGGVTFLPTAHHGVWLMKSPYDKRLVEYLRGSGGPTWSGDYKGWLVSEELISPLTTLCEQIGNYVHPRHVITPMLREPTEPYWEALKPHQQEGVRRLFRRRSHLFRWDMGTGKSAATIAAMRTFNVRKALIVCPASVKKSWEAELEIWWPELDPEHIQTVWEGKDKFENKRITICNYELLRVVNREKDYDFVCIDEAQYITNSGSDRSLHATQICDYNPTAYKLALTGTPVTSDPIQWYGIMSWLLPGAWSSFKSFARRYFHVVEEPYFEVGELNDAYVEELNWRLSHWVHNVTKEDLPDFKKKITIEVERTSPADKVYRPKDTTPEEFEKFAVEARVSKIGLVEQWVKPRLGQRMAVLTHLRATAEIIAEHLRSLGIENVYQIDGSDTPKKRWDIIAEAREKPDAILVSTMHCIKTGLNTLTAFEKNVCYAELYWAQEPVSQSIARFNRWNSTDNAHVTFLVLTGTVDEAICSVLRRRITECNSLLEVSREERQIQNALSPNLDKDTAALVLAELASITTDDWGVIV